MDYFMTFHGETPLHVAAVCAGEEFIHVLLESGADKAIKSSDNKTPFDLATEHNRLDEILALLN